MRVNITTPNLPTRGQPVEIGNVYTNLHAKHYKLVVGINQDARRYNCIVCLHVNGLGDIIGSSNQPEQYVRNHQDLIGKASKMPSLRVRFFRDGKAARLED